MKTSKFLGYKYTSPIDRYSMMSFKRRLYYLSRLMMHLKNINYSTVLSKEDKIEFIGHLVGYQALGLNCNTALNELIHKSDNGSVYFNC